ncbi:MAG: hypothetical protein LBS55_13495, partial [Prevotellaceae bacterium]|nr:hypothetical protein [Prevotellaceae bacterium]
RIQTENALLLSAPRRVGKSSFAKKMLRKAENEGWNTLDLDLERIETEEQFVKLFKEKLLAEKWWENLKSKLGDTAGKIIDSIGEIEYAGAKISPNTAVWRNDNYDKIQHLIESADKILIVMDELAIFLNKLLKGDNGKEKVEFFLNWLRSFRQISGSKARWIFCSSVGIENFASMHQLSYTLNDIHNFRIGAFSEEEAREFIPRLDVDESVKFTDKDIQFILDKLSWYLPYFIQILIEKINYLIYMEKKTLSEKTIDDAWQLLISENYFNSWNERLKEYYEFENDARRILKLCTSGGISRDNLFANLFATTPDPEKAETILAKLLSMLENDGYLIVADGKYTFRSSLLRDFWYNRFIR